MNEFTHPKGGMRTIIWAVLAIVVLGGGLIFAIRKNNQTVHGLSEETYGMLEQVIIPEFKFHEVTLDEAIAHLNRLVAERGLPRELRFEWWQLSEPPKGFLKSEGEAHVAPLIPGLDPLFDISRTELHDSKKQVRYSLALADVPLSDLIRYVSGLFDCILGERGDTIYLVRDRGTFDPLLERTFRVDPSFGSGIPAPGGKIDAKPYLHSVGVEFYEGTEAYVLPNGKLVVRHVQEGIDLIDAIVEYRAEPNMLTRVKWWFMGSWDQIRTWFGAP